MNERTEPTLLEYLIVILLIIALTPIVLVARLFHLISDDQWEKWVKHG